MSTNKASLNKETAATASPGDRPTAADGPGSQRDTNVRPQVEGNGPATGKSVLDEQTRTTVTADALDPANAATGGVDHPTASSSPDAQFAKDFMHWLTPIGPAAADVPGSQRDTNVHQQVEGNGPATGKSVLDEQTRTTVTADVLDPANAATGGLDHPTASSSPDAQFAKDFIHWLNSPTDPAAADVPGAQRNTNFRQQLEGNGPATGTGTSVHNKQTPTTADASLTDPANAATEGHDRPTALGSPGVQGDTDLIHWLTSPTDPAAATGTGTSVRDKQTPTTADASLADPANAATEGHDRPTALGSPGVQGDTDLIHWLTSPTDPAAATGTGTSVRDKQNPANAATGGHRLTASGSPGVQVDTDVHQQGNGSVSSDRDKAQESRTTVDASDPVNTVTAAGQERPSAEIWIR